MFKFGYWRSPDSTNLEKGNLMRRLNQRGILYEEYMVAWQKDFTGRDFSLHDLMGALRLRPC
jgi:hypothetical protein